MLIALFCGDKLVLQLGDHVYELLILVVAWSIWLFTCKFINQIDQHTFSDGNNLSFFLQQECLFFNDFGNSVIGFYRLGNMIPEDFNFFKEQ